MTELPVVCLARVNIGRRRTRTSNNVLANYHLTHILASAWGVCFTLFFRCVYALCMARRVSTVEPARSIAVVSASSHTQTQSRTYVYSYDDSQLLERCIGGFRSACCLESDRKRQPHC